MYYIYIFQEKSILSKNKTEKHNLIISKEKYNYLNNILIWQHEHAQA